MIPPAPPSLAGADRPHPAHALAHARPAAKSPRAEDDVETFRSRGPGIAWKASRTSGQEQRSLVEQRTRDGENKPKKATRRPPVGHRACAFPGPEGTACRKRQLAETRRG